jgi:hypothetical protein
MHQIAVSAALSNPHFIISICFDVVTPLSTIFSFPWDFICSYRLIADPILFQFGLKMLHLLVGASAMGSIGPISFLVWFEDVKSSRQFRFRLLLALD